MPEWLMLLVAPMVGAVLGTMVMGGVVWSQTQAPDQNPASQPVLEYGS